MVNRREDEVAYHQGRNAYDQGIQFPIPCFYFLELIYFAYLLFLWFLNFIEFFIFIIFTIFEEVIVVFIFLIAAAAFFLVFLAFARLTLWEVALVLNIIQLSPFLHTWRFRRASFVVVMMMLCPMRRSDILVVIEDLFFIIDFDFLLWQVLRDQHLQLIFFFHMEVLILGLLKIYWTI